MASTTGGQGNEQIPLSGYETVPSCCAGNYRCFFRDSLQRLIKT